MTYTGSCHCGGVKFSVEGELTGAMACNCSMCQRKGSLLWFVPRTAVTLATPLEALSAYTFNKHVIQHYFCPTCGCAPFGMAVNQGTEMAAINVRCLEDVEVAKVKRNPYDGRSK